MSSAFRSTVFSAALFGAVMAAQWAQAQQTGVWIQVEARSSAELGTQRAEAFASSFTETRGFVLPSGWHAVVLGPYSADQAEQILTALKRQRLIPSDSYLTDGREFRDSFWPPAGGVSPNPQAQALAPLFEAEATPVLEQPVSEDALTDALTPDALTPDQTAPEAAPDALAALGEAQEPGLGEEPGLIDETPKEARASEAALRPEDRQALQAALAWFGHYEGGLDGAFGPGTRNAMAAWQSAAGLEATGILTSRQRDTLLSTHQAELQAYGFAVVEEQQSGISATLPMALLEFERYAPPFVQYRAKGDADLRLMLISQPGDQGALAGLYEIIQALEDVPASGERRLGETGFTLLGEAADRKAQASVRLENGLIKGWLLLSDPANARRDARVVEVLQRSFRAVGDAALDPGLIPLDEAARRGLLEGLEIRKPRFSRSGSYLSADGLVLTASADLQSCGKITLEQGVDAQLVLSAEQPDLALLTPSAPMAPPAFATLRREAPVPGAEVVVAGYPYADRLPAPVLSWGNLEALGGLEGEAGLLQISASLKPGDSGGPVLDASGAMLGILIAPPQLAGKILPDTLHYARSVAGLEAFVAAQGLTPTFAPSAEAAQPAEALPAEALPPEALTARARGMTALVLCWD